MSGSARRIGPLLPVLLFVALVVLLPVAFLFATALEDLGVAGLAADWSSPLGREAVLNSLVQGALSGLLAVGAGYAPGVLLGRYRVRGRSWFLSLLLVPFLLPSLVVILGVEEIVGPGGWASHLAPALGALGHGLPAILLVNVLYNAPMVALFTAASLDRSPRRLEETVATLGGGPWRQFRDGWGPASLRGAAAGGILTFVFSALGFAAPLVLCGPRCYTVEARVFALARTLAAPTQAAGLALLALLLLAAPLALYLALGARARVSDAESETPLPRLPWRRWTVWPWIALTVAFWTAILAFLLTVVGRALVPPTGPAGAGFVALFGPATTHSVGLSTAQAVGNTLFFATSSTALALFLAALAAHSLRRSSPTLAAPARLLAFLPLLVSPVVLAFALASFWEPSTGGAASVWLLILLSQATLALPFALQSLEGALRAVSTAFGDAARTLGATPAGAYVDVELPLARGGLVAAALFAFALSLGEFTATYFLVTPPFTTLTVELYDLQQLRHGAAAAALAGLLVLVSLASFLVIARGGGRRDA